MPLSGAETPIRPEWIQFWDEPTTHEFVVLSIDPAVSEKPSADATALVVLGRTADVKVHCLAALARRVCAAELPELIAEVDRRWQPHIILFEDNQAFAAMCDALQRDPRFAGRVVGVTQSKNKNLRVKAFSIPVERGEFRLRGRDGKPAAEQQQLFEEMLSFPAGAHDDLLDAAATGTKYLIGKPEPRVW